MSVALPCGSVPNKLSLLVESRLEALNVFCYVTTDPKTAGASGYDSITLLKQITVDCCQKTKTKKTKSDNLEAERTYFHMDRSNCLKCSISQ